MDSIIVSHSLNSSDLTKRNVLDCSYYLIKQHEPIYETKYGQPGHYRLVNDVK